LFQVKLNNFISEPNIIQTGLPQAAVLSISRILKYFFYSFIFKLIKNFNSFFIHYKMCTGYQSFEIFISFKH